MTLSQAKQVIGRILPQSLVDGLRKAVRSARRHSPDNSFYCKALTGESDYNICVNSDMSVSCNCQDYDASGHLGDLRLNSLEEIFNGEIAQRFRDELADGKLPIKTCDECMELMTVPEKTARQKARSFSMPHKGIMVENTVACNLECLACDRGVVDTRLARSGVPGGRIMSLDDVRQVAAEIRKHDIRSVKYLNLGEPFLSRRILDEMKIMREFNPDAAFTVSTNGMFIDKEDKQQAALMFDLVIFSIDGASQASVDRYQVGMDFERAMRCMADLVRLRDASGISSPVIEWKYVVFEWNDSEAEINRAINMAREADIDLISFTWGYMPGGKGTSKRYLRSAFFRNLGEASWRGRKLVLRPH